MLYGVKLTPTPGHIVNVLPNQSYLIELDDGRQFRRNEHHITGRHLHPCNCAKLPDDIKTSSDQSENLYYLRPRIKQNVKWPNYPENVEQLEFSIANI